MRFKICALAVLFLMGLALQGAAANSVTDWDAKAVAFVAVPGAVAPPAQRVVTMVNVAMFDAVNSLAPRYRPYLAQPAPPAGAQADAAVASAAATVMAGLDPVRAAAVKSALDEYLASVADSGGKQAGIAWGEAVGKRMLAARADDGASAPDDYRPRTTPGVYVPTPPMATPQWGRLKPFALTSQSQFRPGPPVALNSPQWVKDYNEIRTLGSRNSTARTAQQTETARLWLATGPQTYHPIARQIAVARNMDLTDSARFLAMVAISANDALIAVMDAKYHYNFWRPVTAIRNGEDTATAATPREATWMPLENTPMHPEYPCAHCITAGAVVAVMTAMLGGREVAEVTLSTPTAPGVTHRWTNLDAIAAEVSDARVWAGFHYRFSTKVGTEIGRLIGTHVARNTMQKRN